MSRLVIYPYKMGSKSSKALAEAMTEAGHNVSRVYPDRNYVPRVDDVILNWGCSTYPSWGLPTLNTIRAVAIAANKLLTLDEITRAGLPTPIYTRRISRAAVWINEGYKVFCRTSLTGHSGEGVVIASTVEELVGAPLYTGAFNKEKEFRVHVFKDTVIDIQEKRKRSGTGPREDGVWNLGTDYIFAREGVSLTERIQNNCIKAVVALGLDFGAVDVAVDVYGQHVIFEVNTAPGLEGTTLNRYVERLSYEL